MADIPVAIVMKRAVDEEIEPFVVEGSVEESVADEVMSALVGRGIGTAQAVVKKLLPEVPYPESLVYAIAKARVGAEVREDEKEGVLHVPYVVLDSAGRGVGVEFFPIELKSAEAVERTARQDWMKAIEMLTDAGVRATDAAQIVDEIVKSTTAT